MIVRCSLRAVVRLSAGMPRKGAILAPWGDAAVLHDEIARLRGVGETVVAALPGHDGTWREAGCDRQLRLADGKWIIESLKEV